MEKRQPLRQGVQESLDKILHELDEAEIWLDDAQRYEMDNRASIFLAAVKQHVEAAKADMRIFAQVASDELNSRDDKVEELEGDLSEVQLIAQELED